MPRSASTHPAADGPGPLPDGRDAPDAAWRFRSRARLLRERALTATMSEVREALLWQADRCEREADALESRAAVPQA